MLLLGLAIWAVLAVAGVSWWVFYGFLAGWLLLWAMWTWLKVWAVKKTENQ